MKFEYIGCSSNDIYMNNRAELVDEWVAEVANECGNLDFLDDEEFQHHMCIAYLLDEYRFGDQYTCEYRPDGYFDSELKFCGITEDVIDLYLEDYEDYEDIFDEYDVFGASYTALLNFLDDCTYEISEKFYNRFCKPNIEDFEEIEDDEE